MGFAILSIPKYLISILIHKSIVPFIGDHLQWKKNLIFISGAGESGKSTIVKQMKYGFPCDTNLFLLKLKFQQNSSFVFLIIDKFTIYHFLICTSKMTVLTKRRCYYPTPTFLGHYCLTFLGYYYPNFLQHGYSIFFGFIERNFRFA